MILFVDDNSGILFIKIISDVVSEIYTRTIIRISRMVTTITRQT